MDRRLRNALRQPDAWPKIENKLLSEISVTKQQMKDLEHKLEELNLWKEFYESEHQVEYGKFRLYEIEDGETHTVAAQSANEALRLHTDAMGYETPAEAMEDLGGDFEVVELPPEKPMAIRNVDEGGWIGIKTNAEWANVSKPEFVSTTAY